MRCGFWRSSLVAVLTAATSTGFAAQEVVVDGLTRWPEGHQRLEGSAHAPKRLTLRAAQQAPAATVALQTLEIDEPTVVYVPEHTQVISALPKTYTAPNLADEVKGHYKINFPLYALWFALFGAVLVAK